MSLLIGLGLFVALAVVSLLLAAESRETFVAPSRPRRWFIN